MRKIFKIIFVLFSLFVIGYGVMFIISQMINIKYYFDNGLPHTVNSYTIPIFEKEFFLELIFGVKVLIAYAIYGLILVLYPIPKKE